MYQRPQCTHSACGQHGTQLSFLRIRPAHFVGGSCPRPHKLVEAHTPIRQPAGALGNILRWWPLSRGQDDSVQQNGSGNGSADSRRPIDTASQLPPHLRDDSSSNGAQYDAAFAGGAAPAAAAIGSHRPPGAGALLQSTISALNTLSGPLKGGDISNPLAAGELTDEDFVFDLHEDISVEHQPLAATVGRAFYEVLRLDRTGKTHKIYIKRRDLLRKNRLLPRDLRRIDPSLSVIKTSPSISIKDHALLVNLGGVRMIVSADKCLLFDPTSAASRKWLDLVLPRLATSDSERAMRAMRAQSPAESSDEQEFDVADNPPPPFELELLEAALMVATGKLDEDLLAVTLRVQGVLKMLPREVTPVNLEELRRVKSALVELESKADMVRNMLEELMDDQEDIGDINLSSRPKREERSRQRDRDALEREMENSRRDNSGSGGGGGGSSFASTDGSLYHLDSPIEPISSSRRGYENGEEGSFDGAEAALARMVDAEEAEREAEEVEDLLEYYMQRAATLQSESERLLAGARDLEESIGVSLSARRFEVQRLELTLSIGSFAAALGAMVAGIFGMNLKSTLEESIVGFWGTTACICLGCCWIFWALYSYLQQRRIL